MKNIKLLLPLIVLIFNLFSLTACNNVQSIPEKTSEPTPSQTVEQVTPKPSEEQKSNDIEITLSIYNINKEAIYSEKVKAEKTNLLEIMSNIDTLKVKTEDSEGGKFIVSIMDISYDYGQYWNCYINGESMLENISLYEINDNDVVDLRYEKTGE
jgi:hypothetical protein